MTTTPRRLVPALVGVALLATALPGCDWPETTRFVHPVLDGHEVTTGITYRHTTRPDTGQPIDLKLDVYEPAGDTRDERPVVVWMFGGGWRSGDRNQLAGYAADSARRGYVGVAIDYRTWTGPGFDIVAASNAAYEDTLAAVEWLRDHAADHRLDPDAIVAAGYSAGAVNALHALYRPETSPVAGAVAIAGLSFDPPTPGRPPALVFSGTRDTTVPHNLSRDQCAQARDLGNVCRFVAYEGEDHLIALTQAADIRAQTADFIFEEVLWDLGYRAEKAPAAAA